MRKRKRVEQDKATDPQYLRAHKLNKRMRPPLRQPSRPDQVLQQRQSPRTILGRDANTTPSRKTETQQGRMQSRGKATLSASETWQTTGKTRAQGSRSDMIGHSGLRRSSRIRERRGTEKSTVYYEIANMPGLRSGKGVQQKRHGYRQHQKPTDT